MGKFIITSSCGFIISNPPKRLVRGGQKITIIDGLSTDSPNNALCFDFPFLSNTSNMGYIKRKVDGVFHLGTPSPIPGICTMKQEARL